MAEQLASPAEARSVLVIDPDIDNRWISATLLEYCGFAVLEADDAAEGLRLARRTHPALIVTELFERSAHGWRLIEALRRHSLTSDIQIVAYSAHALPADREAAIRAGVTRYLTKPAPPRDLAGAVMDLLQTN